MQSTFRREEWFQGWGAPGQVVRHSSWMALSINWNLVLGALGSCL